MEFVSQQIVNSYCYIVERIFSADSGLRSVAAAAAVSRADAIVLNCVVKNIRLSSVSCSIRVGLLCFILHYVASHSASFKPRLVHDKSKFHLLGLRWGCATYLFNSSFHLETIITSPLARVAFLWITSDSRLSRKIIHLKRVWSQPASVSLI